MLKRNKVINLLLGVFFCLEVGYFLNLETNKIMIKKIIIPDKKLADVFQGLRVIQISDLHIKKIGYREKELVRIIKNIAPDIIFITGDLLSNNHNTTAVTQLVNTLGKIATVIAIPGNTDHLVKGYKKDINLIKNLSFNSNVYLLINQSLELTVQQKSYVKKIYILGLDDNYTWNDDFFKVMLGIPSRAPKILLVHAPNIIEKIDASDINLVLSGHTHGGQIVFPFIGPIVVNRVCHSKKKYISGLYFDEGTKLYVNQGIGTAIIPLRLFCRPEITFIQFNA